MDSVITIPALDDNYIYLYRYETDKAFVVDPGEAEAVTGALRQNKLLLSHILITHNHYDHTAGAERLRGSTGARLTDASDPDIKGVDIESIPTPGHTADSVCFLVKTQGDSPDILFAGDTLFTGGCGRPMGSSPATMWNSLNSIAKLPEDTRIYPGHNYTAENYEFALTIDPDNEAIKDELKRVQKLDAEGIPAVPSTIGQEKKLNIFLRSGEPEIKKLLNMTGAAADEVFTELRQRKNIFG